MNASDGPLANSITYNMPVNSDNAPKAMKNMPKKVGVRLGFGEVTPVSPYRGEAGDSGKSPSMAASVGGVSFVSLLEKPA